MLSKALSGNVQIRSGRFLVLFGTVPNPQPFHIQAAPSTVTSLQMAAPLLWLKIVRKPAVNDCAPVHRADSMKTGTRPKRKRDGCQDLPWPEKNLRTQPDRDHVPGYC